MTSSKFLEGKKLIFMDFEVFSDSICEATGKPYWMVVFIEYESRTKFTIKNDPDKLRWFYDNYKEHIFVGYNIRGYDQWIYKGILLGLDPAYITKMIIENGVKGHNIVKQGYKFPLLSYDCATGFHSLKQLEAFLGLRIKESSVPFNITRPLTPEEEIENEEYCTHDVVSTIVVFEKLRNKFNAQVGLIDMFDLKDTMISKTSAQLTAEILEPTKLEGLNDEYDFIYPDTYQINRYPEVKQFFDEVKNGTFEATRFVKGVPKIEIELDIANVPTVYALGGLHGAVNNLIYEGLIYSLDVALT